MSQLLTTSGLGDITAGGTFPSEQQVRQYCDLDARRNTVASLTKRQALLKELVGDRPPGDLVILEMVKVDSELDEAKALLAKGELEKKELEQMVVNYADIRSQYFRLNDHLNEAKAAYAMFDSELRDVQLALALTLRSKLIFVERAKLALPIKEMTKTK